VTNHLISIIIPIHNTERYIEDMLKDVLSQTYQNFELLLINDGSIDRSGQICDNYVKNDRRIKVVHKKNKGVSAARNDGIACSTGEYICFLDADDRIDPNYLEELYQVCIANRCLMSACSLVAVSESNEVRSVKQIPHGSYTSIQALKELFEFRTLSTGPYAKLFHRSLFADNLKFPPLKTYEDLIVSYKTIYKAKSLFFTQNTKYTYIHRIGFGAMADFNDSPTNDVIIAVEEILSFLKKNVYEIFDPSFYGLISQIMMYLPALMKKDPKMKENNTKSFVYETKQLFGNYRSELYKNQTISVKEKAAFLIFSYSFSGYFYLNKILKWRNSRC
jgi:glycosyltransferase involved in cell wall biosynthesis